MKISLRLIGILGLLLFGFVFTLTYGVPKVVEDSAKGFVKSQIEKEVKIKVSSMTDSSLGEAAESLVDKLGFRESQLKKDLEDNLPEKIAAVMAQMCGYDCEKKKQLASSIKGGYLAKIQKLKVGQFNLSDVVKGKYVSIVGNLKSDVRIFALSNALMFSVLLLISLLKPAALKHLFVPGILLLTATVVSVGFYVFGQDWFYTIIYNDYMGWIYLVYLGVIFGFFMDIALNKCRVTTEVFNFIGHAISNIGLVSPC